MGMKVILRLQHGTTDSTAIGDDENSFKILFFFCFAIKLAVIEVSPDPFPK